jgi:hypothetical protein
MNGARIGLYVVRQLPGYYGVSLRNLGGFSNRSYALWRSSVRSVRVVQ